MNLTDRMILLNEYDREWIKRALDEYMQDGNLPKFVFDSVAKTRQKMERA